ncbi:MAG: PQQ-dependent sugar dehydrogenase [Myxococcaceae bacterium]|nr:PQQ-dependent sugar dehydrogenase [Myxococcaceae bacterium]
MTRILPLLLLAACSRCASAPKGPADPTCVEVTNGNGPAGAVRVRAETVVSGLTVPWSLTFLPGNRMLVTERPGRLRLVENGALVATPVATVASLVRGESGLLGLAADPAFDTNRRIYLYLTAEDGSNRVERWAVAADYRSATKERDLVTGIPGAQFHDGGRLRFGPDGMLYIGTGDARSPDRSQDADDLAGKILRVNTDGEAAEGNPVAGKRWFITGIRNTQGFDWLSPTELAVTDHGPSGDTSRTGHDEVNVAKAGDNLGWPTLYGCESGAGLVTPRLTWTKAAPPGGAAIYTGDRIPQWKGSLLIGVLGATHLHRVAFSADRSKIDSNEVYFDGTLGRLRDVVMGPDGELYATTSNCDGRGTCPSESDRIVRIVPDP